MGLFSKNREVNVVHKTGLEPLEERNMLSVTTLVDSPVLPPPDYQSAIVSTLGEDPVIDLSALRESSINADQKDPTDSFDAAFTNWIDEAVDNYGELADKDLQPGIDFDSERNAYEITFPGADNAVIISDDGVIDSEGNVHDTKEYLNQQRMDCGIKGELISIDDVQSVTCLDKDNILTGIVNVSYTSDDPTDSGEITVASYTSDFNHYFYSEGEDIDSDCDVSIDAEFGYDPEIDRHVDTNQETVEPIYNDSVSYDGEMRCAEELPYETFLNDEEYSWIAPKLAECFPGEDAHFGQFYQVEVDGQKLLFLDYTRCIDGDSIQTLVVVDVNEQYVTTLKDWANNINIDNVDEICTFNCANGCPVKVYTSDVYEYDGKQFTKESVIIDFQATLDGCQSYYDGQAGKCFEKEYIPETPVEPYRPDVPSHDFHVTIPNNSWGPNPTSFSYYNQQPYNPGSYTARYGGGGGTEECCGKVNRAIDKLVNKDCCDENDTGVGVLCDEDIIEEHCGGCEIVNNAVDKIFEDYNDCEDEIAGFDECCGAINSAVEMQLKTEAEAARDAAFIEMNSCKEGFSFPVIIGTPVIKRVIEAETVPATNPQPRQNQELPAIPSAQEPSAKKDADKASVGTVVVATAIGGRVFEKKQKTSFFGRIRNGFKNAAKRLGDFFYELGA